MPNKFTRAQLAAASGAWLPDTATRRVAFASLPPLGGISDISPDMPVPPLTWSYVDCPIIARQPDYDVVVGPDGKRITVRN